MMLLSLVAKNQAFRINRLNETGLQFVVAALTRRPYVLKIKFNFAGEGIACWLLTWSIG